MEPFSAPPPQLCAHVKRLANSKMRTRQKEIWEKVQNQLNAYRLLNYTKRKQRSQSFPKAKIEWYSFQSLICLLCFPHFAIFFNLIWFPFSQHFFALQNGFSIPAIHFGARLWFYYCSVGKEQKKIERKNGKNILALFDAGWIAHFSVAFNDKGKIYCNRIFQYVSRAIPIMQIRDFFHFDLPSSRWIGWDFFSFRTICGNIFINAHFKSQVPSVQMLRRNANRVVREKKIVCT